MAKKTYVVIGDEKDATYWEQFSKCWPKLKWRTVTLEVAKERLEKNQRNCRVCLPYNKSELGKELHQAYPNSIILIPGPAKTGEVMRVMPWGFSARKFIEAIQ